MYVGWYSLYELSYPAVCHLELAHSRNYGRCSLSCDSQIFTYFSKQYTYYTVTAFNIRVPQGVKQTLTTMQIMQFIVGVPYASLHSFLSYQIPVQVPTIKETISTALSSASSIVAAVATDATIADMIKKFLFRAAGEGGVADNLAPLSSASPSPTPSAQHRHVIHKYKDPEVTYHTEYRDIPCVDTQGQTLAIWMNVFYLLPLTFLFGRFFVKSYITRTIGQGAKARVKAIEKSGQDAVKGVDRKLDEYLGERVEANGKPSKSTNGKAVEDKKSEQKTNKSSLGDSKHEDFEKIEHPETNSKNAESDNDDETVSNQGTPKKRRNKKKKAKQEKLVEADVPPPITPSNVSAGVQELSFADAVKEEK